MDHPCSMRDGDGEHVDVLRLNHMCQELTKVAGQAKSKEAYDFVIETAKVLSIQVEALNGSSSARVNLEELAGMSTNVEEAINAVNVPHVMLLDPNLSQTKGRKRDGKGKEVVASGRLKSGLELSTNKRKRKCNCCGKMTRHDKRNCPENPNAKKKYNETCSDVEDEEEDVQDH
ncbi:hypothetical protein Dimus_022210 [Dionaea muscipula]